MMPLLKCRNQVIPTVAVVRTFIEFSYDRSSPSLVNIIFLRKLCLIITCDTEKKGLDCDLFCVIIIPQNQRGTIMIMVKMIFTANVEIISIFRDWNLFLNTSREKSP